MKYPAVKLAPLVVLTVALAGCSNVFEDGKLSKLAMPELLPKTDSSPPIKNAEGAFISSAPVAPEDYVDASGACAGGASAAPAPPQATDNASGPDAAPALVAGGVGLGMTECQVVQRAGQPGNVEISADANSVRATVLTYMTGTWPGIYRFSAGRLKEIERVAAPPPPPKAVKKKKAAKPKTAAR